MTAPPEGHRNARSHTPWLALGVFLTGFGLASAQNTESERGDEEWVCVPSAQRAAGWECGRGLNKPEPRAPLPEQAPSTPNADAYLRRNPNQAVPRPGAPAIPPQARPADSASETAADTASPSDAASQNNQVAEPSPAISAAPQGRTSDRSGESSANQESLQPPPFLTPPDDPRMSAPAASARRSASSPAAAPPPEVTESAPPAESRVAPASEAKPAASQAHVQPRAQPEPTATESSTPRDTAASKTFVIQLANLNRADDLGSFLARHRIAPDQVRAVAASYPEGTRYLLLWGSFQRWQQARDALAQIPGDGSIEGAWIRPLSGIEVLRDVAVSWPEQPVVASPARRTATASSPAAATATPDPEPTYSDPIISIDSRELLAADPRWYSVQLASMRQAESIQRFITLHQLEDLPLVTLKLWRDGGDWFVLLYGAWPSLAEARTAMRGLPASVQAQAPWARRIGPLQAELE